MNTYDFVHLVLHAFDGTIQGRTKLQKTVYFVGALTGVLRNLGYRAYYYGPYSGEVAAAVNELRGLGFLQQTSTASVGFDPQGFEVARYDYRLTPAGRKIAREKAERYSAEWNRINDAARRLKSMPNSDYVRLSIAAKVFYLLGEKGAARIDDLLKLTPKFGWNVTTEQMEEAKQFLESLGLVKTKKAR